jgi:hypothetical protein
MFYGCNVKREQEAPEDDQRSGTKIINYSTLPASRATERDKIMADQWRQSGS